MKAPRAPLMTMQSNAAAQRAQKSTMKLVEPPIEVVRPRTLRDFEIGKKLGRGKFGRVLLVREKKTGFVCALKIMKKAELVQYHAELQFRREVEIQSQLKHPHILEIYGYFNDARKVYVLVEYAPKGDMYGLLNKLGRFSPAVASHYIAQVASGLAYCHTNAVMHRDIKPENLLMAVNGRVKISDFGWSIKTKNKRPTFCGTLDYLPPEMLDHQLHYNEVDMWALGVLTYEFLTGEAPFYANDRHVTKENIKGVSYSCPAYIEEEAKDFMASLLQRDPEKRMKLSEVQSHPWMQKHMQSWPFSVPR